MSDARLERLTWIASGSTLMGVTMIGANQLVVLGLAPMVFFAGLTHIVALCLVNMFSLCPLEVYVTLAGGAFSSAFWWALLRESTQPEYRLLWRRAIIWR
jgi:hypothetical protein